MDKLTHAQKAAIRKHLDHGEGNRKVRIHGDGSVEYYGSTDHYDRQHDYWHVGGWASEILAEIEAQARHQELDATEGGWTMPVYKCLRCGYQWQPRIQHPQRCPKCNSPYWNKPRRRDSK